MLFKEFVAAKENIKTVEDPINISTSKIPEPEKLSFPKQTISMKKELIRIKNNKGIFKTLVIDVNGNRKFCTVYFSIMPNGEIEIDRIDDQDADFVKVDYQEGKRLENEIESTMKEKKENVHLSFCEYLKEAKEKKSKDDTMGIIFDFFANNSNPKDDDIHKLSEDLGIEIDKFEEMIYSILSSILAHGKYKENPIEPDPKELEMGIKVEMEHTSMPAIAKRIALDHLAEFDNYYTALKKMEEELEKKRKKKKNNNF